MHHMYWCGPPIPIVVGVYFKRSWEATGGGKAMGRRTCAELHKGKLLLIVDVDVHHAGTWTQKKIYLQNTVTHPILGSYHASRHVMSTYDSTADTSRHGLRQFCSDTCLQRATSVPGPAVVPPMAASALEKKVAMFCSLPVGGRPPTYTLRACRVACCDGGCTPGIIPAQLDK